MASKAADEGKESAWYQSNLCTLGIAEACARSGIPFLSDMLRVLLQRGGWRLERGQRIKVVVCTLKKVLYFAMAFGLSMIQVYIADINDLHICTDAMMGACERVTEPRRDRDLPRLSLRGLSGPDFAECRDLSSRVLLIMLTRRKHDSLQAIYKYYV